jgi:replicative DNA helicase
MNTIDHERNIIACLFQTYEPSYPDTILEAVIPDMFSDSSTARMYLQGIEAIRKHGTASPTILSESDAHELKNWLRTISNPTASISYMATEYKRRKIAEFCYGGIEQAMIEDPDEVLSHLQTRLDSLNMVTAQDPKPASFYLHLLADHIGEVNKMGINTGIPDFDGYMSGFQGGQMVVIAGRPAQGKSVLGSQIALHNALNGRPSLMINLEMGGEEIVGRIIAGELKINSERIANRDLSEWQIEHIKNRRDLLDGLPLYIDTRTSHTLASMRALFRKYKRTHDIGLIVIDYLQLIGEKTERGEIREQVVARMSRFIKVMAKELDIPIIILSQLSRESDKRTSKEPQLSDLRESGAIEQDADIVIFVHRPELHGIETFTDNSSTKGVICVNVAKRRNGPTHNMRLHFNAPDQRIEGLTGI